MQAGEELGLLERLGQEVVVAGLERLDEPVLLVQDGEHDEVRGAGELAAADPPAEVQPGDVGHDPVGHDDVDGGVFEHVHGLGGGLVQKTSWPEAERWSWRIAREIGSSSTTRMRRGE